MREIAMGLASEPLGDIRRGRACRRSDVVAKIAVAAGRRLGSECVHLTLQFTCELSTHEFSKGPCNHGSNVGTCCAILSHPRTLAPSHPRTFAPSHLRTFAPSHLRTLAPSHLRTLAPSHRFY